MIIVTQGHEYGIGIEVFLKSFLMLSREEKKEIKFFVNKEDFNKLIMKEFLKRNYLKFYKTNEQNIS